MKRIPDDILSAIEQHFHGVIRGRAIQLIIEHKVSLPTLDPVPNPSGEPRWFGVPGFYGGFSYWFAAGGPAAILISESWSRIIGGSGQRHEITARGVTLIDQGFV
ncbi:MAG: hypothetical protein H0U23_01570 [Blastocatellia bacterium]|nr:hypothetical protein [Blastocatellia bacterium]